MSSRRLSRTVHAALPVIFWGVVLCLSGCDFFSRGPEPVAVDVHFMGPVRLYRPPGQPLEPRYEVGNIPKLLFEPGLEGETTCDPFKGGAVRVVLNDPTDAEALALELPLQAPQVRPVHPGWLMSPLPASIGAQIEPFRLPDRPGRWTLTLDWRCSGDGARLRRDTLRFWVHRAPEEAPETAAWWAKLAEVDKRPAAERADGYEVALKGEVDPETRLWTLRLWTEALLQAGRFPQAEQAAIDSAAAAEAAGFPSEASNAWDAAHEAARSQGRLDQALVYLDRALAVTRQLDFRVRLPEVYYGRAVLYNQMGQPLQALETAVEAQAHALRAGKKPLYVAAYGLEIELLQALGHHRDANRRIDALLTGNEPNLRGDAAAQVLENPVLVNNLGWLILRGVEAGVPLEGHAARAVDRAEKAFRTALAEFEKRGEPLNVANADANLALARVLVGDPAGAKPLLEPVRKGGELGDPSLQLFYPLLVGSVTLLEHHAGQALETFRRLEAAAERENQVEYAGRGAFLQGEALRAMGRLEEAIAAYDSALDWIQEDEAVHSPLHQASILSNRALWEARAVQARLEPRFAGRRDLEALDVVERGAWARRQTMLRAARRESLPAAEQAETQKLREEIDGLDRELVRLRRLPSTDDNLQLRKQKEELRQRRWAQLEMKLDGGSRGVPPALDLETIRARVPRDGVVLRFAVLPDELVVWSVGATGVEVRRERVSRSEIEAQVGQFARSCREGRIDAGIGETLARRLLGPLAAKVPPTLVLVGDGAVRELPWAALPVAGGALIERSVLYHLPTLLWNPEAGGAVASGAVASVGVAALNGAAAQDGAHGKGMLIVADPGRNLPAAAKEGRDLRVRFPEASLLEREAATRSALTQALPRASLVHYAGHGVTDPERPYLSHLKLANDERLSLMEIRGLTLHAPLVFLNACEAGMASREGGGALGIADGLLAAGAGAVIASRWDIPDQAAVRLSSLFYERLFLDGRTHPVPVTLAETQRALLRGEGGDEARNPAVWSAFLVLGDGV